MGNPLIKDNNLKSKFCIEFKNLFVEFINLKYDLMLLIQDNKKKKKRKSKINI